jgi:hypothetical protein
MVIKKGFIKDVSKNMELENLMQQLNSDNDNKDPKILKETNAKDLVPMVT